MVKQIDINADIGEGYGNYVLPGDEPIMKLISSANIACGYHAGDPLNIKKTVQLAKKHGVSIGAHPGLPDLMGFGRRVMEISPEEIYCYILYQVGALKAFVEAENAGLHHLKPHGAFYRSTKEYKEQAVALAQSVLDIDPNLLIYCPGPVDLYHPKFAEAASDMGLRVIPEFYADLEYSATGALIPPRKRKLEGTPEALAERVIRFLIDGKVRSEDGADVQFEAASICIHGDNPLTLGRLEAIRSAMEKENILVRAAGK